MENNIVEKEQINVIDFLDLMFETISRKFNEQFPGYFIRCKTLDKNIYDTANKSGYSYYIRILNADKHCCFENSYKIADYYETQGIDILSERQRLFDSLNNCNDIRIWCFDNIQL